ncbi:hypothetical protein KM800_09475 [Clostridium tyrobutyricum]|uniref:hypothetical protein n=1 Tax=Clostridium tyrobutyricum TaxID=1519 RepID=UPI001C38D288|nr:hypothetical protein [Clostridium tyrobutyricum]MBV4419554.1 hypothetical protein [Clostridium tyrobutyricum]
MKYTRYDLKKEKGTKNFVLMIALVLIAAFIIGTVASKIIMNYYNVSEPNPASTQQTVKNNSNANNTVGNDKNNAVSNTGNKKSSADGSQVKFVAVQGGIYKDKKNVAAEKNLLMQYGTPFAVQEDDKVRIFLGIYEDNTAKDIMASLTKQKVDNSNMDFTIKKTDACNVEIIEIIDANLQVLNKVSQKDIQSIKTDQLKKWCSSLESVDKNSKNFIILKDLKENVSKLPSQLSKDKVEGNYLYIYNILKKIK